MAKSDDYGEDEELRASLRSLHGEDSAAELSDSDSDEFGDVSPNSQQQQSKKQFRSPHHEYLEKRARERSRERRRQRLAMEQQARQRQQSERENMRQMPPVERMLHTDFFDFSEHPRVFCAPHPRLIQVLPPLSQLCPMAPHVPLQPNVAGLQAFIFASPGQRSHMEDRYCIDFDGPWRGLFGVFDGHAGASAAHICALKFPSYLARAYENISNSDAETAYAQMSKNWGMPPRPYQPRQRRSRRSSSQPHSCHLRPDYSEPEADASDCSPKKDARHYAGMRPLRDSELPPDCTASVKEAERTIPRPPEVPLHPPTIRQALAMATRKCELRVLQHAARRRHSAGTTLCVACVLGNLLHVANLGDSRCVLSRGGVAFPLSVDHVPRAPREQARIALCNGTIHDREHMREKRRKRRRRQEALCRGSNGVTPSKLPRFRERRTPVSTSPSKSPKHHAQHSPSLMPSKQTFPSSNEISGCRPEHSHEGPHKSRVTVASVLEIHMRDELSFRARSIRDFGERAHVEDMLALVRRQINHNKKLLKLLRRQDRREWRPLELSVLGPQQLQSKRKLREKLRHRRPQQRQLHQQHESEQQAATRDVALQRNSAEATTPQDAPFHTSSRSRSSWRRWRNTPLSSSASDEDDNSCNWLRCCIFGRGLNSDDEKMSRGHSVEMQEARSVSPPEMYMGGRDSHIYRRKPRNKRKFVTGYPLPPVGPSPSPDELVTQERVMPSTLTLTRSIGDSRFKRRSLEITHEQEGVLANLPDIMSIELHEDDEFLIIATDGFWSVVSNEEAVRRVRAEAMLSGSSGQRIAEVLVNLALQKGSKDNCTVMLVFFTHHNAEHFAHTRAEEERSCPAVIMNDELDARHPRRHLRHLWHLSRHQRELLLHLARPTSLLRRTHRHSCLHRRRRRLRHRRGSASIASSGSVAAKGASTAAEAGQTRISVIDDDSEDSDAIDEGHELLRDSRCNCTAPPEDAYTW
ncbi:MAG: hypothetical protein MHM6MM_004383 [Cercozoa sp. M6MM]